MRILFLFIFMILSTGIRAQQESDKKMSLGFDMGYLKVIPGDRLVSTDAGYLVETKVFYAIKPGLWIGAGWLWGASPSVDAQEYAVFAPRDHPIWFETSQYFASIRKAYSKEDESMVRPFIAGRIGWETEFSEYSGPRVERRGLLIGISGGLLIRVLNIGAFEIGPMLSLVRLGDATVFDTREVNTTVGGSFFGMKAGFEFRF